jgi:hypothetical protein
MTTKQTFSVAINRSGGFAAMDHLAQLQGATTGSPLQNYALVYPCSVETQECNFHNAVNLTTPGTTAVFASMALRARN